MRRQISPLRILVLGVIAGFSIVAGWAQEEPPQDNGDAQAAQEVTAPPEAAPEPAPVTESAPAPVTEAVQAPAGPAPSSSEAAPASGPSGEYENVLSGDEEALPAQEPAASAKKTEVPEEYTIQKGDTLWDICGKFLDNPWYWPKLWALNQYIENPHLIFPGNKLSFFAGSETAPPKLDIVGAGKPEEEGMTSVPEEVAAAPASAPAAAKTEEVSPAHLAGVSDRAISIKLKSIAFISPKDLENAGHISHSGEQKAQLVFGDRVYLDFKNRKSVSVGDRFHVFETVKKVKDPSKVFGSLGYLIKIKSVIRVIAIHKNTAEAAIIDNEDSISRGDRFVPYVSPIRIVKPHSTERDLAGRIVEAEHQQFLISNNDFVYLNLGKKQGVDEGLKMMAVRRGDGVFPGDDQHLPDVIVGRLLIVDTKDNTSTAYVTDLRDSLSIGDRVVSVLNR